MSSIGEAIQRFAIVVVLLGGFITIEGIGTGGLQLMIAGVLLSLAGLLWHVDYRLNDVPGDSP